jgi:hypothetical protein
MPEETPQQRQPHIQLSIRFLLMLSLVCAVTMAGWKYLRIPGALLSFNTAICLPVGISAIHRGVARRGNSPVLDIVSGSMCVMVALVLFTLLAGVIVHLQLEYGWSLRRWP